MRIFPEHHQGGSFSFFPFPFPRITKNPQSRDRPAGAMVVDRSDRKLIKFDTKDEEEIHHESSQGLTIPSTNPLHLIPWLKNES
jgi:hypothetical protein